MHCEEISKEQARVEIINSIKHSHKDLRQKSKGATFALTYMGTSKTLEKNFGFTHEEAQQIYNRYHDLYKVSDQVIEDKLQQAAKDGYLTVAFGLRVRTPKLAQSVTGSKATPKEAVAEKRTAGNAIGQSYGLLNCRAAVEFMNKVKNSPYANQIKHCNLIHQWWM